MADEQQLAILRSGVNNWNNWRKANFDVHPNLGDVNLENAGLANANLIGANLVRANLFAANLFGANLGGANLAGANVTDANLSGVNLAAVNLAGASLKEAILVGARLDGARLTSADLSGAILEGTKFVRVNLSETVGLDGCFHRGPSSVDRDTLLPSRGLIPDAFLRGCGFADWEIEAAKLYDLDLSPGRFLDIQQRIYELRQGQPIQYYSVFISHSSENKAFARALHDELQDHGIRCWLDEKQVLPGDDIYEAIDRGVRHWDKLILCCSKPALERSWWVESEIEKSLGKEQRSRREDGRKVLALIPIDLDGYLFDGWESGVKSTIMKRKVGDFRGWSEGDALPEESLEALVKALQLDDAGREAPPLQRL